jgi:hypothetical protein
LLRDRTRYRGLHHGSIPVTYFILRLTGVGADVQGLREGSRRWHYESWRGLDRTFIVNGGIDREDASGCFSVNDLEKVATACTELKYLCLNLYEIDTGRLESDILGPQQGAPFQPSEFEQALYAIETILKLRSLHITNPSNYRKAFSRPREFFRWHARSLQNSSER